MFARLICVCLALLAVSPLAAQDKVGKKYALLVGVKEYAHPSLRTLRFTENDVVELGKLLEPAGYQVTLLCDNVGAKDAKKAPTKANVDRCLADILGRCGRGDTVLVALAGHGVQFEGQKDSFFCPADAKPFRDRTETMVSLGKLYEDIDQSFAAVKVIFVDACRDDPKLARGRSGVDGDNAPRPPRGVAVLFSCAAGEMAYEHEKFKHGVFFYHILEGLRGKAKNPDGEVSFHTLVDYTSRRVSEDVERLIGDGAHQSPNMKADLVRNPVLMLPHAVISDMISVAVEKAGPRIMGYLQKKRLSQCRRASFPSPKERREALVS
jgi:uncharacterized caspase-like protein